MNNETLLDEIEEYLANHGSVQGVPFSEEGMLQRVKTVREEVKRQADLEIPREQAVAAGAKEEKKVARQFYYRTDGCPAKDSHDPDCVCWHDEGDPLEKILTTIKLDWRDKPA